MLRQCLFLVDLVIWCSTLEPPSRTLAVNCTQMFNIRSQVVFGFLESVVVYDG